jgi:meso-butanediol dehydrogenase/(S,S)-butanediol dehydrogenase/diacetyl reductase
MVLADARLRGKVVLVTGAGRGIGRAIAERVAAEGAAVCVADLDVALAEQTADDLRRSGGCALAVQVDVTDREQVRRLLDHAMNELGGLDVAFNNAGIVQNVPLLELTDAQWSRMQETNAGSVFICLQEEGRRLISQGRGGKIINTSSIAGRHGSVLQSHYSASKFSVISLTQSAARSLAKHGITVNAMNPGIIDTHMLEVTSNEVARIRTAAGRIVGATEIAQQMAASIPLGRLGTPADVAGLAYFLASSDSDYVTGQAINVCGGLVMD